MKDARASVESEKDMYEPEGSTQDSQQSSQQSGACVKLMRASKKRKYAMTVKVGVYNLICVSTVKKIHLKLEPGTIVFINKYIVPLVVDIIHKMANHEPISAASSNKAKAPFSLTCSSTPGCRDKVTWKPEQCCYCVTPKLADKTQPMIEGVVIPLSLSHAEYVATKEREFWKSATMWNTLDRSNRERIPEELVPHASRI